MKLALLGGGGFRVPLVYRTLMRDRSEGRVTQVRLHDVDTERLHTMAGILRAIAADDAAAPEVVVCSDLVDAITGVDFVFSAIRVGGTAGRAADERIAHSLGIIGQETTGFGGISYALRGLPVAMDIARTIAEHNPSAWLISFTNPAGIITEATSAILGDRVIGICDSPIGLARRAAGALEQAGLVPAGTASQVDDPASAIGVDYAGLNHLGWLQGLTVDGTERLGALLARPELAESFEEGRLFGAEWIRTLGCVPNEYLHYYYFSREVLTADAVADATRGIFLEAQQGEFYAQARALEPAGAWDLWEKVRRSREETYMATSRDAAGGIEREETDLESGGYDRVALAIMHAIAHDRPARLIVNVPNRGRLPLLPDDAIIEVPCVIDASGAHALPGSDLPAHARGLVQTVKHMERTVIQASATSDRDLAIEAMALHPLIGSVGVARRALDAAVDEFPQLAPLARGSRAQ